MITPQTKKLAAAVVAVVLFTSAQSLRAAQMFAFDLDSLAHLSSAVIEGDVVRAKTVNSVDVLTVKITRSYAGDLHVGSECVIGLSAYGKHRGDFDNVPFAAGDHLILFMEPVTQEQWKKDGIAYWLVSSGVKVITGDKVTGMLQWSNPGPYVNTVDEGDAKEFRKKLEAAIKWAAEFKKQLAAHEHDAAWLLARLTDRPVRPLEPRGFRDEIAVTLCQALAATRDKEAIAKARAIRRDYYERELLGAR